MDAPNTTRAIPSMMRLATEDSRDTWWDLDVEDAESDEWFENLDVEDSESDEWFDEDFAVEDPDSDEWFEEAEELLKAPAVFVGVPNGSLRVSVIGRLDPGCANRLEFLKAASPRCYVLGEDVSPIPVFADPRVAGGPFYLHTHVPSEYIEGRMEDRLLLARNRGPYRFFLENGCFLVEASTSPIVPVLNIRVKHEALHRYDLLALEPMIERIADILTAGDHETLVNRWSYAIDLQHLDLPMVRRTVLPGGSGYYGSQQEFVDEHVVSRAKTLHAATGVFGPVIGSRSGGIQAVFSRPGLVFPGSGPRDPKCPHCSWTKGNGFDQNLPIWRMELLFHRRLFRDLKLRDPDTGRQTGINTVSDLASSTGDVLRTALVGDECGPWLFLCHNGLFRGKYGTKAWWWPEVCRKVLEGMPVSGRKRLRSGSGRTDQVSPMRTFASSFRASR